MKERPSMIKLTETLLPMIKADPNDKEAEGALQFLLLRTPQAPAELVDMVAEHHLEKSWAQSIILRSAMSPNATASDEKLLAKVAANEKLKPVLAFAKVAKAQRSGGEDYIAEAEKFIAEYPDFEINGRKVAQGLEERIKAAKLIGIGKEAPEIEGEDLDGKKMKLSDYRGKVVVLDFWGDW
jgi:hypothetical protein